MSAAGDNTSYAPKSPDLSSFYTGPEVHSTPARLNHYAFPNSGSPTSEGRYPLQVPIQAQARAQVQAQVQAHVQAQVQAQLDPGTHNFSQPQPHYQYQTQHYNNNSSTTTSNGSTTTTTITNHNAYHLPPQQQQHQHPPFAAYNNNNNSQHALSPYHPRSSVQYYPQQQPQPQPQYPLSHQPGYNPQATPYYSFTDSPASTSYLPANQGLPQHQHPHPHPQPYPQQPALVFDQPTTVDYRNTTTMPRGKAVAQAAKEPDIMDSPVRTKFPTARIKRIMQADEEVGKVAQQTPIAVGKALELFMVQLVHRSAEVAKEKNSKRITASMLKQAIDSTNEWDFLRDIVAKVAEEKDGGKGSGRTKAESDTDEDVDAGEVKKKGRGGRKKKVA
ncbi:hypothetical protein F4859DRAFT_423933 [Xylaria cf. heliscus]|nr:hypothetical protein F4859DRAFT_423933 [Xylaria cf. heliscus]